MTMASTSPSPQFHQLSHLSALLWAIALVAYTWAVATRARTSVPACPCEQYAAAFLPFNHSTVPADYGISHHCYDAVRWAMHEDAKPEGRYRVHVTVSSGGAHHIVGGSGNNSGDGQRRAVAKSWTKGSTGKFYGKVDKEGGDPPDREAYVSFFVGKEEKGGTFVEIGAGDGMTASVSRFFEESLGWHGLLIDGSIKMSARGPATKNLNSTVCHPRMEGQKVKWIGIGEGAGVEMYMSKEHIARYEHEWGEAWKEKGKAVKCAALGKLLEKAGIGTVDLMIVSVNGAESAVLEGLDVDHVHVKVVVVNVDKGDAEKEREVRKVLLEKGMCFSHRVGRNEFWVGDGVMKIAHCAWAAFKEDP